MDAVAWGDGEVERRPRTRGEVADGSTTSRLLADDGRLEFLHLRRGNPTGRPLSISQGESIPPSADSIPTTLPIGQ